LVLREWGAQLRAGKRSTPGGIPCQTLGGGSSKYERLLCYRFKAGAVNMAGDGALGSLDHDPDFWRISVDLGAEWKHEHGEHTPGHAQRKQHCLERRTASKDCGSRRVKPRLNTFPKSSKGGGSFWFGEGVVAW
jgi:hypothetical protein